MAKEQKAGLDIASMSMDEICEALNKKYGVNTIIRASEAKGAEIRYISTGSYALDFGLGGGFPMNRIIELRGPFSSFKSTLSLYTIKNFLRKHEEGIAIYIDLEKSFDRKYASNIGIDLDRVFIVNPDSGEQAINLLDDLMQVNKDTLVILDSVAALIPSAEIVSEAEQQHMGLQARLVNKMMRIATARLKRNLYDEEAPSMTVICLNQLRMKIGVMFGNPETTPGGEGKNFFYSTIVRVSSTPSNLISKEETRNGVKHTVQYGQTVSFKVQKNKCGGPQHEQGEFTYYYKDYDENKANTFNNLEALFHYGAFNNVIEFDSSRGYVFTNIAAKKEGHFIKLLRKNPSAQIDLYNRIIAAVRPKDKAKALSSAVVPKKKLKLFA
jgi:recombination protein RecA